jgi:hypothetical protein
MCVSWNNVLMVFLTGVEGLRCDKCVGEKQSEWESEREGEGEKEKERKKERESVCVCVCEWVSEW